jgi:hypothetical protein
MTTTIGLFEGFSEAQRVIHPLVTQGIRREDITLIVTPETISVDDVLVAYAWGVHVDVGPASRGQPAALLALGVPADAVELYAEGLRRGGTLVSVTAAAPQMEHVCELMERYAAADVAAP